MESWELETSLWCVRGMVTSVMLQVEGALLRKVVESLDESEVWSLGFSEGWGRWDWEGVYESSFV